MSIKVAIFLDFQVLIVKRTPHFLECPGSLLFLLRLHVPDRLVEDRRRELLVGKLLEILLVARFASG
jgi:hypothetical protein